MKRAKALLILLLALLFSGAMLTAGGTGEPNAEARQRANLLIDVSGALVHAAVYQPVDRTEPVQEIIQETPVEGMGRTVGMVGAVLVPDASRAAVDVVLQGCLYSRTVGTRPHVLVFTETTTPVVARRRILIDAQGLRAFAGPACADATTRLLEVCCRREPDALAICFAKRGFQQSQGAAEAEISSKTARRFSARLAEDLSPSLVSASRSMGQEIKRIRQAGLALESLEFQTTATTLQTRVRIGTRSSGPLSPSPALPSDVDLGVRIHQSVLNEAARKVHGGKSFSLDAVSKFYQQTTLGLLLDGRKSAAKKIGLEKLEKLLKAMGGKPATITLDQDNPLTVDFANQGFRVEIHVASIQQDGMTFAGMRVRGEYRLVNSKEGVELVRQGEVQFLPPLTQEKMTPQPVGFQLFREVLFAEIMKERLILGPLPLRLQAPQATARDGWLMLTWKGIPRNPQESDAARPHPGA